MIEELEGAVKPDITGAVKLKYDGTPKAVKKDGTYDKRGGPHPGAGRKRIHEQLTNYGRALSLINDHIEDALNVLIEGLQDKDKWYRKACAELLLKKAIADKKQNEHLGGKGSGIDKQDIAEAIDEIDSMIGKRIKQAVEGRAEPAEDIVVDAEIIE